MLGFRVNGKETNPPLVEKSGVSRREHRQHKEFTSWVKDKKFDGVGKKCEMCSKHLTKKKAHFHHKLSLSYAFHYFPQIPDHILKSEEDCQVLCSGCHEKIHQNESYEFYATIAAHLLKLAQNWNPDSKKQRTERKNPRSRRQRALQLKADEALAKLPIDQRYPKRKLPG